MKFVITLQRYGFSFVFRISRSERFPHQDRKVAEVIVHEDYQASNLFNDIALLILDEPVILSENVKTACLPPQDFNFDGIRCLASGWGKDQFEKGRFQDFMKKIDMPIILRQPCEAKLRTTPLGNHFNLHQSFICAGEEHGKNTFVGDGGSPLVCPIPGEDELYYQAGIVAWGVKLPEANPGEF